jgi:membrane-associated phospholipid phosphatase
MQFRPRLLLAVVASCLAHDAAAQSVGDMFANDVAHASGDVLAIWQSPFDASSRYWMLSAGASAAFGLSMFADRPVGRWAARDTASRLFRALEPVRRGGAAYTGKVIVPPIAGLYVAGIVMNRADVREAATGCMSSWFSQSMLRQTTYRFVARQRPDTSPEDSQRWGVPGSKIWQLQSFPAGHFANVMSCSAFWSNRYRLGAGAPALYLLAAAIGLGRIADGGHWISDTVLGGIIGYATGRELARRSLARARQGENGQPARRPSSRLTRDPGIAFTISF